MLKAFSLGLSSSFFFAFTFVLNREMETQGGHWIWSSSLRFFFMLPILWLILLPGGRYKMVFASIRKEPGPWLLWSTVGFGIFYSFICIAAASGPSWLTASAWQLTIVAGVLLSPLFYADRGLGIRHRIPHGQLFVSALVLAGVFTVQVGMGGGTSGPGRADGAAAPMTCLGLVFVVVAAFAYPLGNRKMMELVGTSLGTAQRVFGMTLCSTPFWVLLSLAGVTLGIAPVRTQVLQTFIVALSSGVVATLLFFKATTLVKSDVRKLAVVESTQAGEVVFSLLGGVLVFGDRSPSVLAMAGIGIVIVGIIANAVVAGSVRHRL
ncbi:MAG: multidrug resistance efflux transporter family protein [Spirochaetota bacterium]